MIIKYIYLLKTENQIAEALKNYFQLKGFKVVKCTNEKQIEHCGQCSQFPCDN